MLLDLFGIFKLTGTNTYAENTFWVDANMMIF